MMGFFGKKRFLGEKRSFGVIFGSKNSFQAIFKSK